VPSRVRRERGGFTNPRRIASGGAPAKRAGEAG
jgi:hypothetical protein